MNKPLISAGLNVTKTQGTRFSTAILSLAMLAGMSACESEQSPPVASATQPKVQMQVQAPAAEMNPQEQMVHRHAIPMREPRKFLS